MRNLSRAEILQDLLCSTGSFPCCALHKALPGNGTVLTREVHRPLAHPFVATKAGILSDAPARIASKKKGITCGVAQCGSPGVVSADAWEDPLQLLEAALSIVLDFLGVSSSCIRCRWCIGRSSGTARIIDKKAMRAWLTKRCIPEYLDIQVRDDEPIVNAWPGTILVPVACIELQEELGDGAVTKLLNSGLL